MKNLKQLQMNNERVSTKSMRKVIESKLMIPLRQDVKRDEPGLAANLFLAGESGKFGKYFALPNALVYRTIITSEKYGKVEAKLHQDIIAIRLESGLILGNASILPLIGRSVSFGNDNPNRSVTEIQTRLGQVIPMLPFNVFQETGLSLSRVKIIDQGPEETVIRSVNNPKYDYRKPEKYPKMIDESVHFTGSKLFETDGVQFLFDIDRVELNHKIFNPFLAKLPRQVTNIAEAYQSLKPKEVLEAEAKGLKVLRQGEWFLIPSDKTPDSPGVEGYIERSKERYWEGYSLRAGNNRPNTASKGFKIGESVYVSGKLEHSGREHKELNLKGWYQAVPNTAIESFTISGNVD